MSETRAHETNDEAWCIDCGEFFRYDDCGGYNPPCVCGAHCRDCHDAEERSGKYADDDYECDPETSAEVGDTSE